MTDVFEFTPEIRVYEHDQGKFWAVSFDTRSAIDAGRAPRVVFIAKTPAIKQLSISIEGFDSTPVLGDDNDGKMYVRNTFRGTIGLTVKRENSGETSEKHVLAECSLKVVGKRQGNACTEVERKNGYSTKYSYPDVGSIVRNKCADALSEVMADFFALSSTQGSAEDAAAGRQAVANAVPVARVQGALIARSTVRAGRQSPQSAWHRYKPWAAVAAAALVVWVALAAISYRAPTPSQEVGAAVSAQLQQDPNAAMAQVELTKQTLASMGLDPGASGDTGCLASPPAQATGH